MSSRLTHGQSAARPRDLAKCSVCRQRKQRCNPQPHDWDLTRQRCDYCDDNNLACGPNYKNKDDPHVIGGTNATSPGQTNSSSQQSIPNVVSEGSTTRPERYGSLLSSSEHGDNYETKSWSDNLGWAKRRKVHNDGSFPGVPKNVALEKITDFNAGVTILMFSCQYIHKSCQAPHNPHSGIESVEEGVHRSFVDLSRLSTEALDDGQDDRARWILSELVGALGRHPRLYESRKPGTQETWRKIFSACETLGLQWNLGQALSRISNIHDKALSSFPYQVLAGCRMKTSEMIDDFFRRSWEARATTSLPSNSTIPALHLALQNPNPDVVLAILLHVNGISPHVKVSGRSDKQHVQAVFDTERVQETFDMKSVQDNQRVRELTDARDFLGRTALFLAATSGCGSCCYVLLQANADPNSRDPNGHTVLEMAIVGGHRQIIERLLALDECNVNPRVVGCESTPLQAAIECDILDIELIYILLNRGANVDDTRSDGKTAINLANDKALVALSEDLQQRSFKQARPFPFG